MMESIISRSTEEDLLSELPSDVLVSILEKLSLRDAVRVGVLSRRWRCLPALLPRLALDIASFLPSDARDLDDHHDILSEAGDKLADVATALLQSRRPPAGGNDDNHLDDVHTTTTLAMRFYLRHNYMSLGRLLDAAVAGGKVHAAELTITTTCRRSLDDDDDYENTERSLVGYGRRFRALFDACPAAFGAVTQLTLEKMRHGKPDLDDILTTCTGLEKLSLRSCGPGAGALWDVQHARLKDIRICLCAIRGVKLIWLPRLERFTLQGWLFTTDKLVSLGHVPRLTTVTLSEDIGRNQQTLKLSRILTNSTALRDLRLNFRDSNIWVQPETSRRLTNVFSNLKNLKIRNVHRECGLAWIMFLLQSAPHLEELYVKLMEHDCEEFVRKNVPWEVDTSFKHYSLARVTILGFYRTEETIVTFIRHIVEAAVNLDEIRIRENVAFRCVICGHMELPAGSRFPQTNKTEILLGRESSMMADQLRLLSKYIFNRRDNGNMAMQTEMTRFSKTVVFKTVVL